MHATTACKVDTAAISLLNCSSNGMSELMILLLIDSKDRYGILAFWETDFLPEEYLQLCTSALDPFHQYAKHKYSNKKVGAQVSFR